MRYIDIKDKVITTTHSLRLVPQDIIETLMWEHTFIRWYRGRWANLQHPSIECVIHALIITDNRRYHTVCTITVDGIPAFYFLSAGREGGDFQSYCILNADALKALFKYMVQAVVDREVSDTDIPVGNVYEEVPDLSNFYQKDILYGIKYNHDTPSDDVSLPMCRL